MNIKSTGNAFIAVLQRDLTLGMRHRAELVNPLLFYLIVVMMFPLAIGPNQEMLQRIAPGVIWVAALLASTLALDLMFRSDFEDGTLEQILLSHHPVILLVIAKITAHWLLTGAPIIVAGIFLGIILNLQENSFIPLLLTLLLGTPVLSLVGSAATALTIGLRSSGMLLALLILPLYVPVLIFAVAAVNNAAQGLSIQGELFFLSAILVLSATLAPFATAASLRIRLG